MENRSYKIVFAEQKPGDQLSFFKEFIEKKVAHAESVQILREEYKTGEMGIGDVINAISILIKAANEPLTELAKALRDYVAILKTEIEVTNGEKSFKIKTAKPQKVEELVKMLKEL